MYFTYLGKPNFTPNQPTAVSNPITNDKNFISKIYPTITTANVGYNTGNMYGVKKINIQVYNNNGQEVFKTSAAYQNGTIDLSRLSKGVYYLSISTADEKYKHLQKIIRQ